MQYNRYSVTVSPARFAPAGYKYRLRLWPLKIIGSLCEKYMYVDIYVKRMRVLISYMCALGVGIQYLCFIFSLFSILIVNQVYR